MITTVELCAIMPACSEALALTYAPLLSEAMAEFFISTPQRSACFLAQVAHESMQLRCTREVWGPTPAQLHYEGRIDLGNTVPGDGFRFLGRGLIQVTGRANYARCSRALFKDARLLDHPELLEAPAEACRSAGWFWALRGLNRFADCADFDAITLRVNGSLRTSAERRTFLSRAQDLLHAHPSAA